MRYLSYASVFALAAFAVSQQASAHAIVGNRIFPATLAVEDPGVADELTLPQISRFKGVDEESGNAAWVTTTSAEYGKRITRNLGLSVEGAWVDTPETSGWDNVGVGAKYVVFTNADHEFIGSIGADLDIGNSGSKRLGVEDYSVVTPALFFGKGFGDLPESASWLKPLALTGKLGYALPSNRHAGEVYNWGATLQYSLPYLQQHVKDVGLSGVLADAIPTVELALETPRGEGRTTGTINPGVIFMGDKIQIGAEAMIPLNSDSGSGVGGTLQVHFYLDNLLPNSLGKPIW